MITVHAALCRRLAAAETVRSAMRLQFALGIRLVPPDRALVDAATRLARTGGLTAYDAAHAAFAEHLRGRWLTFDQEAARRVGGAGRVRLLPLD